MPNNLRIPSPPERYTPDWGRQLQRAVEQNLLDTAPLAGATQLANDFPGRITTQAVLPFAGTFTYVPATMGLNVKITQAGNQAFTFDGTGLPVGAEVKVLLVQDATGGRVTTFTAANLKGTAPTLSVVAGKQNLMTLYWDGFFFCWQWNAVGL